MKKPTATPGLTDVDLEQSEDAMIKMVAEMHEGMIMAIVSVCVALDTGDKARLNAIIAQLHRTSAWMLENRKPALTQYPADKLMNYLEMLVRGEGPPSAQH